MPGLNTGPSFMQRFGNAAAGITNGLAQNYGDPALQGAARGSSQLLRAPQRQPFKPSGRMPVQTGINPGQMPGQRMPLPTAPPMPMPKPMGGPINTMPQMPQTGGGFMAEAMPQIPMGGSWGRMGNTGITGGMGLFNRYNSMQPQF